MNDITRRDSSFSLHPSSFVLPRGRTLEAGRVPSVMAILNVTPDSFSDGGIHYERQRAIDAALKFAAEGAAVIDVGGESTRPGSEPVSEQEELDRVVPVIEAVRARSEVPISIDTRKVRVAAAAIAAGADIINDVTALREPAMRKLAAEHGVPVILMHMRGEPRTMQDDPRYDEVVADVARELRTWRDEAVTAGVSRDRILIDPGIGFGKTFDHNLELLARCDELRAVAPVVIGASRKAFIGHVTGQPGGAPRMAGSLGAVAAAVRGGAALVRVHDVRETIDFLRVTSAIATHERSGGAA